MEEEEAKDKTQVKLGNIREVDALKGFSVSGMEKSPVQIADYQKIQYEELLREMQRDVKELSKTIIQTYLEMIGESDTYEGRKEREKLERLSPIVILDLVKKRFAYTQAQIQQQIDKYSREEKSKEEVSEKSVDIQMAELTSKISEQQSKLQQMKDRADSLLKNTEEERKLRLEAVIHSRAIVESIKEDKRKLQKIIDEKDKDIKNIQDIRERKEELQKGIGQLETKKEQLKQEMKNIERTYKEEISKLEIEHIKGFDEIGKKLEEKRLLERRSEQQRRDQEMETIEKQLQQEMESDKQMTQKLNEVQTKLSRQKQKQKELEQKEKIESRENVRLKKEIEQLKRKNVELNKKLKFEEDKLQKDVDKEAERIHSSIKKDIETILLSKTKQDDYIEEVLSSHKRLSTKMKDMIVKERELQSKLKSKEEELKELKKNQMMQRTRLWQEKPVKRKDIRMLSQLFSQSTKAGDPSQMQKNNTESLRELHSTKKKFSGLENEKVAGLDSIFHLPDNI